MALTMTGPSLAQDRPAVLPNPPPYLYTPGVGIDFTPGAVESAPDGQPASCAPGPAAPTARTRVGAWYRRCKQRLQAWFLGFPEEFEAPPLGASVYACARTQVANAEAARMILSPYHFVDGTDQLTPWGKNQLAMIAHLLPANFFPVVIEATPCPALDEARRLAVLNELGHGAFAVPPERVVIGPAIARGMSGVEARITNANFLLGVQAGGVRGGAAGGGAAAGAGLAAGPGGGGGTLPP
jgi:hypothetical protein